MRVLVVGGAGYIGSNMVAVLRDSGHEPIVYDNLSKGHKAAVKSAKFILGDLGDFDLLAGRFDVEDIRMVAGENFSARRT